MIGGLESTDWGADDEAPMDKDVAAPDATRGEKGPAASNALNRGQMKRRVWPKI